MVLLTLAGLIVSGAGGSRRSDTEEDEDVEEAPTVSAAEAESEGEEDADEDPDTVPVPAMDAVDMLLVRAPKCESHPASRAASQVCCLVRSGLEFGGV